MFSVLSTNVDGSIVAVDDTVMQAYVKASMSEKVDHMIASDIQLPFDK